MNFRKHLGLLTLTLVIFCSISTAFGASDNNQSGTTAFPFLKLHSGARVSGMGSAATGLADDESALYYNPAGLTSLEGLRFIAGYQNYVVDMQSGFVGVIKRLNEKNAVGFQLSYLNYGKFIRTDEDANILGEFSGGSMVLGATFAHNLNYFYSVGATVKGIYQKVDSYSATGIALDLGGKYTANRGRYTIGAMVQNVGTQLSSLGEETDPLPTALRVGGSLTPRDAFTIVSGDAFVSYDRKPGFALGAEVTKLDPLSLRAGWNSYGADMRAANSDDNLAGFSFGVGIKFRAFEFSYAFSPSGDLGDTHRITLTGGKLP